MEILRLHNTATTIYFPLVDFGATDFESTPVTVADGDAQRSIDGAAFSDTANPVHEGGGIYSIALVAGDLNGALIVVRIIDQSGPKLWEDTAVIIATYGNASAQHAFDLDSATVTVGTNNDKTGYALSAAGVDAIWDEDIVAAHGTADTAGLLLRALGALISQRSNNATLNALLGVADVASTNLADAVWDEVLTGATHAVADSSGRRLRNLQEFGVYDGGAIFIDTVDGTAGTTDFESGTAFNPVNSIADANTLAASLKLSRFRIAPGSSITFAAAQQSQEFEGSSWTLDLGGQDIANTTIIGAEVSGVAVGTGTQHFMNCSMGAVTLPDDTHISTSDIVGTQILPVGNVFYDRCHAGVIGTPPQFDFGAAVLNTDLHLRNYSGGVDLRNMGQSGTDEASIEGRGDVTVNVNCIGGNIFIRGLFELTDNGSATITDTARYNSVSLIDGIFDEDIIAAHGTADTAGLLLRALGGIISQRSNNPTLDALLGVADVASRDVPSQILTGETLAELAAAIPDATPTMAKALMLFYMMTRNKFTSTATLLEIFNDAGAVIAKKVLADDGTKYTETEAVAGP